MNDKEIKIGDWVVVKGNIGMNMAVNGYVMECKVKGFLMEGISVWDGVDEGWTIEWSEIGSIKPLLK
tara:strand:+ start:294 stop:494 length:201 start_codon:yes stop_codon:yes gene_type:complete